MNLAIRDTFLADAEGCRASQRIFNEEDTISLGRDALQLCIQVKKVYMYFEDKYININYVFCCHLD